MDLDADSGIHNPNTTVGGPGLEQELSLSSAGCQTESGGPLLLQLLEFKTHLFEAVEELHIRKDAETRFEDQISKLVLEKQELEWEKESLQHRIKTVENQHTESLTNVKKQFQAKIRNIEEEKGKYQVSAELKDKENNNLKEELRSLQLLKYNLENKSNELEQKLALQSRSKDSHLNQLGEVEKRFSALSRQCTMVKQAHEKLEQNVDEAMRINTKLSSANEKQEATIVSLKKELEEVSNKLIKGKMTSVRHDKTYSHTGKEQHVQRLHQKLNMETDMNMKLREEIVAVRAEKQEVMRSLQHTQQLLLSQTQTVNRVELELQTQKEQYQALKQEHEVMRDKSKAMEDKVVQLMESYAASKTGWDKERKTFLDCIKSEQRDLRAAREAYDELQQKHTELSSLAKAQAQHISELEMRNRGQSFSVSTQIFPLNEPISSSELPGFGSLQHLALAQPRNPDCLEDAGAVTNLDATGATGGQEDLNHHQRSSFSPCIQSGETGNDASSKTRESDPGVVSDLINTTSSVSDNDLMISKGSGESGTTSVSRPDHVSINGSVGSLSEEKNDGGKRGMRERQHGGKDDGGQEKNNTKEEERNTDRQWDREEVQGEDVKEEGSAGEKRGTLTAQTTDSQGSAEEAGDTRNPETEKRGGTDGAERGETAGHTSETPEAQILTQTTIEKSNARRVVDFTDTESPPAVCEPSGCSQSLTQKVPEKDPDSRHADKGCGIGREGQVLLTLSSDDSVHHGPDPISEVQNLCHDQVQTQDAEPLSHQVFEKTAEEKPTDESAVVPLPAQTNGIVSVQELETTQTQASDNLSDFASDMKQTVEMCDKHVKEECVEVSQSQDMSEQDNGHLKCLVPDDDDDDDDDDGSSTCKKSQGQSNLDTEENYESETVQGKSNLKDVRADTVTDTVDPESEVESGSCRDRMKNDKIEDERAAETHKSESYLKPSVRQTGPRSSFGCVSVLHQFVQGSEQNTRWSGGSVRHPLNTAAMFAKSKHSRVPSVITGASDLLNASSVCGNAASSTRHRQGEWKALGETCRETTAAADTESGASLSISSFPASTSSGSVRELSWQVTPGCSSAPPSAAHGEPCCSQEREDQQSSFRAQISKIEQFLNTERLRLPKRRRTDD
ncbi:nucleoprotein TPR-like isoform X2 [Seriola aureovittata]|uniref:nucleoprotein TPR-like isoform X2 n=1 Tax=Seriola aureovittata TaxID=2871759 RepID=UPI0024BE52E0|nr:nucleoprotein TPR-like isoform X2 [Seriola aureovittata]